MKINDSLSEVTFEICYRGLIRAIDKLIIVKIGKTCI